MSTNGTYGFRVDGVDKVGYNHWDSYPSGLGSQTIATVRKYTDEELRDAAERTVVVGSRFTERAPLAEQARYMLFSDQSVDDGRLDNWYVLLRKNHGDLGPIIDGACDHLYGDCGFTDQEWGYCIDVDDSTLEVFWGTDKIGKLPLDILRKMDENQVMETITILQRASS